MNKTVKKIIAREGLIFVGIISIGLILAYNPKADVSNLGHVIFWIGYPVYLLVRFIIWAVKTLMDKA